MFNMTLPTRILILLLCVAAFASADVAPEIDPGAGGSALATLGAAILILRSRYRKPKS